MTGHLTEAQLHGFTAGTLGEHEAVLVALHLDQCPMCAARAVDLDPLAPAFAASADPAVPTDLAACILAAVDGPGAESAAQTGALNPEVAAGAGLLVGAALLTLLFGDPVGWATRAVVVVEATSQAGRALAVVWPTSILATTAVLCALSAAAVWARGPFEDLR
jgi:anti-sigma factor RsiW